MAQEPLNPFLIEDTFHLLSAVSHVDEPITLLADKFFGSKLVVPQDYVAVESRSEGRLIAPMIVKGAPRGVDINRAGAKARYYRPIAFGPRRVIALGDLQKRLFGEIPNLYTPTTPAERAARLQAEDMADLLRMHANRREQLASQLLQTGKIEVKAYADDGNVAETDVIDYGWDGLITPTVEWDDPDAKIYDDLFAVSERIQRRCGVVPTEVICGRNVEKMLLNNKEIRDWLIIPNRENLTMAGFAPHFTSPECRYIGYISALNMTFTSYVKTYIDENHELRPYINDNTVIVASGNLGRTIYTPITLFSKESGWQTIASEIVPRYTVDEEASTMALTLYSSYVLVPDFTSTWCCLVVKE